MIKEKRDQGSNFAKSVEQIDALKGRIGEVIFGQEDLINEVLCCLLASGHVLITGAPGLAKTSLVRVIARNLGLHHGRIQFTPDLLPSDITGCEILNNDPETQRRNFVFSEGPIFANFVLADEINRASPRTQSALLEAMQEKKVTVAGKNYQLPEPFMVFATQNPFESEGTFPLPEAQLDRFLVHAYISYPEEDAELRILKEHSLSRLVGENSDHGRNEKEILNPQIISDLIAQTRKIQVSNEILVAIRELVRSTRPGDPSCPENIASGLWYGASPRAGISLVSVSRALALMEGHEQVSWQHVRRLAKPALRHRIRLTLAASRDRLHVDDVIESLLVNLEVRNRHLVSGL